MPNYILDEDDECVTKCVGLLKKVDMHLSIVCHVGDDKFISLEPIFFQFDNCLANAYQLCIQMMITCDVTGIPTYYQLHFLSFFPPSYICNLISYNF